LKAVRPLHIQQERLFQEQNMRFILRTILAAVLSWTVKEMLDSQTSNAKNLD